MFGIIEIGSNNTKTHIYENNKVVYENTTTIEFKKNYQLEKNLNESDIKKLFDVIKKALKYTLNIHVYGCSIFRNISDLELKDINSKLKKEFNLEIEVVSQEDEAYYTALGCFNNNSYDGNLCIFIGGGGSTELLFVKNKEVIAKKYYPFGVVDITHKFPSLKENKPTCSLDEVKAYLSELIDDINEEADVLVLAGGDHLYWYNNAGYKLLDNTLYDSFNQKYMITKEMSDKYDQDAFVTSLDRIRQNSDNPIWFDGSRAMKAISSLIADKIKAKYIVPTKNNMEDGLREIVHE